MIEIYSQVKTPIFKYCHPCERPWYVYSTINIKDRNKKAVRIFDIPMNEHDARVFVKKNHDPKRRWFVAIPASEHNEPIYFYDTYN